MYGTKEPEKNARFANEILQIIYKNEKALKEIKHFPGSLVHKLPKNIQLDYMGIKDIDLNIFDANVLSNVRN